MTTLIPKYTQVTTANRTIAEKFVEILSVKDFGAVGDGTTDDTAAIQAAINSLPVAPTNYTGAVSLAPNSIYKITAPLVLQRGQSLIGDGTPVIKADFTSWTGDLVAIKFVVQTADSSASIYTSFAQSSYGFTLRGANNSAVVTTGMKFYTSLTIALNAAVNYAYIGSLKNIVVEKFDTGVEMLEFWNSNVTELRISQCRQGLYVHGKSVNVFFNSLQITNPTNDNTSSTADTIGIFIDYGTQYSGATVGRPEGFTFVNGLIYGHFNNLYLNSGLKITFDSVIIDGANEDCVHIVSQDELVINNCYIYTAGAFAGINFAGVAAGTNSATIISNNTIVGSAPTNTCYGINFVDSGLSRNGINISNNSINAVTTGINALLCPNYSAIIGNYGEAIDTQFIYVQNNGVKTNIAGNTTSSSVPVLVCHPTVTDPTLQIGFNASPTNVTLYKGKATLLSGTTTIALPNNFWTSDLYYRPITSVTFNGNPGANWWVNEAVSNSASQLQVASAAGSNIDVHYTVTAVPFTAF